MDQLPPELVLKIAGYCDYAEVCAMSKLDRRWNELIRSNWNSLKKTRVEHIWWDFERAIKDIRCGIRRKDGSKKLLQIQIANDCKSPPRRKHLPVLFNTTIQRPLPEYDAVASELLEKGWIHESQRVDDLYRPHAVRPADDDKFLEDLFTPVFRQSTIRELQLNCLKSSTLQVLISLLERFRPTIDWLDMKIGWKVAHWDRLKVKVLEDAARIVELSKPSYLRFCIADSFTEEEVCEHFMKRISVLRIPHVSVSFAVFSTGYGFSNHQYRRTSLHGPLPKCRFLVCSGTAFQGASALAVKDIVDLIEEWCNNERVIENYSLDQYDEKIETVAAKFEEALRERNLPLQIEVVQQNSILQIKKIETHGDCQDVLGMHFGCHMDLDGQMLADDNFVIIHSI